MSLEQVKVTGVKFFAGEIDGKKIDSGKIFVEELLDYTRNTAKGYASTDYALANANEAQSLMHNTFPLVCNVDFQRVTNGDTTKIIVTSCRPVTPGTAIADEAAKAAINPQPQRKAA